MPTFKEKLYFNFNGVDSRKFNLVHIDTGGSMFEESLVASRDINESKVAGSDYPSFNRLDLSPRSFDLNLAFEGQFTDKQVDEIVRWLFVDYYKPLYFIGNEGKLMYCIPIGDPKLIHNGLREGYIQLTMRCNSPFIYSPIMLSEEYDLTNMDKSVILTNKGHKIIYPEISIQKIGDGDITITSRTDRGRTLEIRELDDKEKIYINSEKEIIETDIIGVYRYNNVFGEFPRLLYGENRLEITGRCKIQFRYQEIYEF